ncbi:unnamed protein product [Ambrosiozyma monospora]|uniref:Unnamed protein product n=1 Tax=Ambrosiozyma monospora TaxID=43982 RepID=A0ACB5U178_AMBMO|nr:unnamed protein product [Ambrosiozyma monospora]
MALTNLQIAGIAGVGIAGIYALSRGSGGSMQNKTAFKFPSYKFAKLNLVEKTHLTHNVDHYTFALASGSPLTQIPVTAPVLLKMPTGETRPFTPIYNSDKTHLHFAIKNYNRSASGALSKVPVGSTDVSIAGPLPHIDLQNTEDKFKQVYLIGAGAGITPLWSFLNSSLSKSGSQTKLKLIYSNHSKDDIIFKNEIDELKKKYPDRFDVVHVLNKGDQAANYTGRLNSEILKKEIDNVSPDAKVLVCGPPQFISMVAGMKKGPPFAQGKFGGALKEIGFTKDQVVKF